MRLSLRFVFAALLVAAPALAQDPPPTPATEEHQAVTPEAIAELSRRLEVLAAEVERLRSGEPEQVELTEARRRALGLAPSAAATYRRTTEGVSLAGYGEMLLENYAAENQSGGGGAPITRLDFLRAVLYTGYRFNERFLFNSEIEVEHGNEVFVEFAYVDYFLRDNVTLRGGLVLLPLGLVNEAHEPGVFLGARRPETEQRILPSTWRENGAGVLASLGVVNVRAYVTNGFSAAGFTSAGLRGGRQRGVQARAADVALSGRVDVTPVPGFLAGVGLYHGGAAQDQVALGGQPVDVDTSIVEVHAQGQFRGLDVRGLFARATVGGARDLSLALRLPASAPVAEVLQGGYAQIGYNVLSQLDTRVALTPYLRRERVDTQRRVPAGFTRDLARDVTATSLGIDLKPIPGVVVKTEYQWMTNAARTGRGQFNVNLGYAF
jgi:hypothetical protein